MRFVMVLIPTGLFLSALLAIALLDLSAGVGELQSSVERLEVSAKALGVSVERLEASKKALGVAVDGLEQDAGQILDDLQDIVSELERRQ